MHPLFKSMECCACSFRLSSLEQLLWIELLPRQNTRADAFYFSPLSAIFADRKMLYTAVRLIHTQSSFLAIPPSPAPVLFFMLPAQEYATHHRYTKLNTYYIFTLVVAFSSPKMPPPRARAHASVFNRLYPRRKCLLIFT